MPKGGPPVAVSPASKEGMREGRDEPPPGLPRAGERAKAARPEVGKMAGRVEARRSRKVRAAKELLYVWRMLDGAETQLRSIEWRIDAIEQRIDELEARLNEIIAAIEDLNGRCDYLEDEFNELDLDSWLDK